MLDGACVVCGPSAERDFYEVPEAASRSGEVFTYYRCRDCGSLQIAQVPADLAPYYSDEYYSFGEGSSLLTSPWLRMWTVRRMLRLANWIYLRTGMGRGVAWARSAQVDPNDRLLDLGCGSGVGLLRLHLLGYRHLVGADPFIASAGQVIDGVPLLKAGPHDVQGTFDWVVMNHAFEHVADPRQVLRSVHDLLSERGRLLLRIPLMEAVAWREYGVNWAQIDAPRHLVLYTRAGLERLVESEGYRVEKVFYDSFGFQFWGSELAAAGTPFNVQPEGHFSAAQLRHWQRRSEKLNHLAQGDQAGFVLRPR